MEAPALRGGRRAGKVRRVGVSNVDVAGEEVVGDGGAAGAEDMEVEEPPRQCFLRPSTGVPLVPQLFADGSAALRVGGGPSHGAVTGGAAEAQAVDAGAPVLQRRRRR